MQALLASEPYRNLCWQIGKLLDQYGKERDGNPCSGLPASGLELA